ncbi:MAG: translocation/assembly module TamB [Treponema sp.]|nr:translocation/assembly module TamB [Treponema sp.]
MKKIPFMAKASIAIFLIITVVTVLLARPLYKTLERTVSEQTEQLRHTISQQTGLVFTYESFSPSILSSFNIKNIKLQNESAEILTIKNTRVTYKIREIFKQNYSGVIRGVSINGVHIELSELIEIINKLTKDNERNPDFDFYTLIDFIPANVSVNNISLVYKDPSTQLDFTVKQISALNTNAQKSHIEFRLDCNAQAVIQMPSNISKKFSGEVYLNGSIYNKDEFEKSSVFLSASNVTDGTYKLNRINLLLGYKNEKITLNTIQNVFPVSLEAEYDINNNSVSAQLNTDNLNVFSVVSVQGNQELVNKLKDFRFSVNANGSYDIKNNTFTYGTNGSVFIPGEIIPKGGTVVFDIGGNNEKIDIRQLKLDGELCSASCDLYLDFNQLQLVGYADLNRLSLPNGTEISTELYFDSLPNGYMIFSPEVFIGEKVLTALQAKIIPREDSVDFEFEISDYSSLDMQEPGLISLDGSYLLSSQFVQTSVSLNRIYVKNIMEIVNQIADEKTKSDLQKVQDFVNPFMFTGDVYLSSDFKSVSYNVPYLVLANTEKDNQLLFLSANGNEQSIQLNHFDLIYDKFALNASAGLDMVLSSKAFSFFVDATTSSIPYHLQGSFDSDILTIEGDYGTEIAAHFGKNKEVSANIFFDSLPISYEKISVVLSADASFSYSQSDGPDIQVVRFEIEETDPSSSYNPKLSLSGSAGKDGAQLNSITYTDLYTSLDGTADITININDNLFDSANLNINLKDAALSGESVMLDATVSNPDQLMLTTKNLMESLYISALAEINHFSLNRFMAVKNSNNEVSATLSLSGTLEHPYVLVDVQRISFLLANEVVNANGTMTMEDSEINITNFTLNQSQWMVKDVAGKLLLKDFTGSLKAVFATKGAQSIELPMNLAIYDTYFVPDSRLPESMLVSLSSSGLTGDIIKKTVPFQVNAIYSPDFISFYSSDNLGLTGTYSFTDGLNASLKTGKALAADATGNFSDGKLDLRLMNVYGDLPLICDFFDFKDMMHVSSGIIRGYVSMSGTFDTPDFKGSLTLSKPEVSLPQFFHDSIVGDRIIINASNNEISLVDSTFAMKGQKKFTVGGNIYLNKWLLDNIELRVFTLDKQFIPLNIVTPVINISGDLTCDLKMKLEDNVVELNGKVFGEKINVNSSIQNLSNANLSGGEKNNANAKEIYVKSSLEVFLGTHVLVNFDPLLRCIFAPNTHISLIIDSLNDIYQIDGQLNLKSGDITYINRNFYIKEGSVKFNPYDLANPQLSVKAETREKDKDGKNVRIILTAEKQFLLDFNPKFSSIPAKSDLELQSLLGQVAIGDSYKQNDFNSLDNEPSSIESDIGNKNNNNNNFWNSTPVNILFSAGDYYLQSNVTREMENKLRESLNFDIFSLRTNIVQNVFTSISENDNYLSNFLNNTTVYIGKYIGSAIYVDAMLNVSREKENGYDSKNGYTIFKPELGLEFELPLANTNVRWSISPDIFVFSDKKQFKPNPSLSLSWNFYLD